MRALARALCAAVVLLCLSAPSATTAEASASRQLVVSYRSSAELASLDAEVVRRIPALHSAVVEARGPVLGEAPVLRRALTVETPALAQTYLPGVAWEW